MNPTGIIFSHKRPPKKKKNDTIKKSWFLHSIFTHSKFGIVHNFAIRSKLRWGFWLDMDVCMGQLCVDKDSFRKEDFGFP